MSSTTANTVAEILAVDAASRRVAVADDIFALDTLCAKAWDYSLPTLVSTSDVFQKSDVHEMKSCDFAKRFAAEHTILQYLDWHNVLIAGGGIGKFLYTRRDGGEDIDIFLYGLTVAEANVKIVQVCADIVKGLCETRHAAANNQHQSKSKSNASSPLCLDYKNEHGIRYTRTRNTLTICAGGSKFQVIFRLYATVSEILHGFDIGSSAIGFDGTTVWLTSLGKLSYEYGINVIDTTRRSTSYEHRLQKYAKRGFEIVMPRFDIAKLADGTASFETYGVADVCAMPNLVFTYNGARDNKIVVSRFYNRLRGGAAAVHDYDDNGSDNDVYKTYSANLTYLIQRQFERIVFIDKTYADVLADVDADTDAGTGTGTGTGDVPLKKRRIDKVFSRAKIDYMYDRLSVNIASSNFPTKQVEKFINVVSADAVFAQRTSGAKDIVTAQKARVYAAISEYEQHGSQIVWLESNPGTQLSGSFNPIIADERDWYGKYYV